MSRLSSHRANAPDLTKKTKSLGLKNRGWRKGESLLVEHPYRQALNEAIRNQDFGIADAIAAKRMRRVYASQWSKQDLLRGLADMLKGVGLSPKTFGKVV